MLLLCILGNRLDFVNCRCRWDAQVDFLFHSFMTFVVATGLFSVLLGGAMEQIYEKMLFYPNVSPLLTFVPNVVTFGSCSCLILREYLTCSVCIPATGHTWTKRFAGSTGTCWTQGLWGQDDCHDFIVFFLFLTQLEHFLIPKMFSWPTQCFSGIFFQGPPGPPGPPGPKVSWSRSGDLACYWKRKKTRWCLFSTIR